MSAVCLLLITLFIVTTRRKFSRLQADFQQLSEEVKGLMVAEQRRAFKEISATKKEDVDGKPSATLDREPQISESKKENSNGHSPSLSLARMKKKQWQWHDYVAVAVGLLFVTAVLFSFRINDWVMRTFTWD